jgi:tetratricopeptide (TPR) repeat protein
MKTCCLISLFSFLLLFTFNGFSEESIDVNALLEKLNSDNISEKQDAIWKLGNSGDKKAVEPLIKLLTVDALKTEAALALAKLGDKSATLPICELLKDTNQTVRGIVAEALITLNDPDALEPLRNAYRTENQEYPKKRMLDAIEKLDTNKSNDMKNDDENVSTQSLPLESYTTSSDQVSNQDLDEGLKYYEAKDNNLASIYLRKAFDAGALDKKNMALLIKIYKSMGNSEEAIKIGRSYESSYGLDNEIKKILADTTLSEGEKLYKTGEFEKSEEYIKQALSYKPGNLELMIQLGEVLHAQGKVDESRRQFEEVIKIYKEKQTKNPDDRSIYLKIGKLYQKMEKYDDAINELEKASLTNPNNSEVMNQLGYSYYKAGMIDKGFETLQKAIKMNPNSWEAHFRLGSIYIDLGKYNLALNELTFAKRLYPDELLIDYKTGIIYLLAGHKDKAREYLTNFIKNAPLSYKEQIDSAKKQLAQIDEDNTGDK